MTVVTEGPEWDEQRKAMETKISEMLAGRAKAQGWLSPKGKLTAKGQSAALEFIIGMASGFEVADHYAKAWILNQAFLCSIRGVDERFPFVEAAR